MFSRPILTTKQDRAAQRKEDNLINQPTVDSSIQCSQPVSERSPYIVPRASTGSSLMPSMNASLNSQPNTIQVSVNPHAESCGCIANLQQAIGHKTHEDEMLISDDPFTSMPDVTDPFVQEHSLSRDSLSKFSLPLEQTFPIHAHHPSASTYPWNDASRQGRKNTLPGLSSMTSLARGTSFPGRPSINHAGRTDAARMSSFAAQSQKENRTPSQARLPTSFPGANRVPTPNPLVSAHPCLDPELLTKDSSTHNIPQGLPDTNVGARVQDYRSSDRTQHPLRRMSRTMTDLGGTSTRIIGISQLRDAAHPVEIIDVDALSPDKTPRTTATTMPAMSATKLSPFKLSHKPATSSMDSTRRLENALFHALTDGDGQPGADFNIGLGMTGLPLLNTAEDDAVLPPISPSEPKEAVVEGSETGSKRKVSDVLDDDEDDRKLSKIERSEEGSVIGGEGERELKKLDGA